MPIRGTTYSGETSSRGRARAARRAPPVVTRSIPAPGAARSVDFRAVVQVVRSSQPQGELSVEQRRRLIADVCRLLGRRFDETEPTDSQAVASDPVAPKLSPRMRDTLDRLLAGDSEKEIAYRLGLSPNTVHVYVKALYRAYDVNSRGELLAHFLGRGKGTVVDPSTAASLADVRAGRRAG